jgi:transposase-like protein
MLCSMVISPSPIRPRQHATRIVERVNALLREELRAVPTEQRGLVLDHVQDHIAKRHFNRQRRKVAA